MKQIVSDFKEELEQNLDAAVNTVKTEPKKFFQSAKTAVIGKPQFDPLVGDKPAPSKKMMGKITDLTAMVAKKRTEEVRKRLEQIRNEAIDPGSQLPAAMNDGKGLGPEVKGGAKKLTAIQQNIKNAQTTGEARDGGMG